MRPVTKYSAAILILIAAYCIHSQTTAFTFQGKLTDLGSPANGEYQMQFKMFDALSGGTQIGTSISDITVTVADGVFTTRLDFGVGAFPGSDRFLEIDVRRNSGEAYVTLSPRQQIASSPYSVKAISAVQADTALDSQKLGGVDASEYLTNTAAQSNFIRNDPEQQTASFNISGNGYVGGNFGIGTTTPNAKLNVVGGGFPNNVRISDSNTTATALDLSNTSVGGRPWRFQSVGSGIAGRVGNLEIWEASVASNPAMIFQPNGNVGIGTAAPGARLDVVGGPVRSYSPTSTHLVAETTGGTNAWAKVIMKTPARSWTMGTARDFNGNQFYLVDDNTGNFRMTVQPDGGTIAFPLGNIGVGTSFPAGRLHVSNPGSSQPGILSEVDTTTAYAIRGNATAFNSVGVKGEANQAQGIGVWGQSDANTGVFGLTTSGVGVYARSTGTGLGIYAEGNVAQSVNYRGLPKAMLFVTANGIIQHCYNATTGANLNGGNDTVGCGFSVSVPIVGSPSYTINLGMAVTGRFLSLTSHGTDTPGLIAGRLRANPSNVVVHFWPEGASSSQDYIRSDFYLIVY